MKNPHLESPEIRFNWGYHDAASTHKRGQKRIDGLTADTILGRHFDDFYAAGWVAGWKDSASGQYKENSESAFIECACGVQ